MEPHLDLVLASSSLLPIWPHQLEQLDNDTVWSTALRRSAVIKNAKILLNKFNISEWRHKCVINIKIREKSKESV